MDGVLWYFIFHPHKTKKAMRNSEEISEKIERLEMEVETLQMEIESSKSEIKREVRSECLEVRVAIWMAVMWTLSSILVAFGIGKTYADHYYGPRD